jgi:integrase
VKAYITTLSCVLELAAEQGRVTFNPCRKVKWPRGTTRSRRDRVLSYDEEERLMSKLSRFPEPMDAARLSLNTGMRKTFILNLKTSHVDLQARSVRFCGKGGREQRIPLNAVALEILTRLVGQAAPEGFLFRNRTGNSLSSKGCAFQSAVAEAGIRDFHFHDLRHTFATRVEALTSAFTVRDLMGHSELRTTNIYVGQKFEEMRQAVDALASGGRVLAFKAG